MYITTLFHVFQGMLLEEPLFIHPSSVLHKQNTGYVVYQAVEETSKLYMKGQYSIENCSQNVHL